MSVTDKPEVQAAIGAILAHFQKNAKDDNKPAHADKDDSTLLDMMLAGEFSKDHYLAIQAWKANPQDALTIHGALIEQLVGVLAPEKKAKKKEGEAYKQNAFTLDKLGITMGTAGEAGIKGALNDLGFKRETMRSFRAGKTPEAFFTELVTKAKSEDKLKASVEKHMVEAKKKAAEAAKKSLANKKA